MFLGRILKYSFCSEAIKTIDVSKPIWISFKWIGRSIQTQNATTIIELRELINFRFQMILRC